MTTKLGIAGTLVHRPLDECTKPPAHSGAVYAYIDQWWCATDIDGVPHLAFYRPPGRLRSPHSQPIAQTNTHRAVIDHMPPTYPEHYALQVPAVFVPHRCEDYR